MSERMSNAMALADKCWVKAMETDPVFVQQYLETSERLLKIRAVVNGDIFCKTCRLKNITEPSQSNAWVSGPRVLEKLGWITKIGKVVPQEAHNHMPVVTQYRSNLYEERFPMAAHSNLGPSGHACWSNCPGSVKACADYPRETNVYAAEGTTAHSIGEQCLKSGEDADTFLGDVIETEGMEFTVDREMVVGVQMYLDLVRSEAKKMGCKILVEKRVKLTKVHKDIWGTADAILIKPKKKKLKVVDLKYGRGVVEAEENGQGLTYATGAMIMFDENKEIEEIEMIIVQPRVTDPIKRWTVDRQYMQTFAKQLRADALATEDPNAPRVPGEKQCQWCQHKPHCPEVQTFALDKAMIDFDDDGDLEIPDVAEMGINSVAEVMQWVPLLQGYISAIQSRALHLLEEGKKVEGFKLVDKVGRRSWEDGTEACAALEEMGLDSDDMFHPQEMLSPAQMEKLLTKDLRAEMAALVVKKSSGTKMVPEDDPAQEVSAGVVSDFADD